MTTEERLVKVERELAATRRRSRWLMAALGLALGAWVLAGTLTPKTAGAQGGGDAVNEVRARRLVLVDGAGRERAVLEMGPDGPWLDLFDAAGKPRAMLGVTEDGPGLDLYDAAGKTRAMLTVNASGSLLSLSDAAGETRAALVVDKDVPGLTLRDAAGKTRATLGIGEKGPILTLNDESGKPRAMLGMLLPVGPGLILSDAAGEAIWSAP